MAVHDLGAVSPPTHVSDSYKRYLQANMPKYSAKDFAAGADIPIEQLDLDIALREARILQYKKLGFTDSALKTEVELQTLRDWREKVKGKKWAEKPQDAVVNYYDKKFIKNLKTNLGFKTTLGVTKPTKFSSMPAAPEPVMLQAGKASIDQKYIMRMGMLSNCNVRVARAGGYQPSLHLGCSVCSKSTIIEDHKLVYDGSDLPLEVTEFCKEHRHDAVASQAVGRLFKDD